MTRLATKPTPSEARLARVTSNRGLRGKIGLAEDHAIVAPITVGWPRSIPPIPERKEPQILAVVE